MHTSTVATVKRWQDVLDGIALADVTPAVIQQATNEMAGCSGPQSVQKYQRILRAILGHARDLGTLRELPVMRIGRTRSLRLDYLSEEEAKTLLERAWYKHFHMVGFCLFALYSGGRPGEILALEHEDVRVNGPQPTVTYSHRKGKDGAVRTRTIDLHPRIISWMIMHAPASGHLILDAEGRPYNWGAAGQRLYKAFLALLRDSGIRRHVTPYALRHSFATWLRWKDVELDEIKDLLGHASIEETMI